MDAGPSDRSFWINGVINVSLTVGYGTSATEAPRFPHTAPTLRLTTALCGCTPVAIPAASFSRNQARP